MKGLEFGQVGMEMGSHLRDKNCGGYVKGSMWIWRGVKMECDYRVEFLKES